MNQDINNLIDQAEASEDQRLTFKPSAPLDRFLWLNHKGLDDFINDIASSPLALRDRKQRTKPTQEKFLFALKSIVLNLLKINQYSLRTLLAISKAVGAYSFENRYDQRLAAYRPFMDAYDLLIELGYVREVTKGFWDKEKNRGQVTRIEATHKLLMPLKAMLPQETIIFIRYPGEENIRLRDENKKWVDYTDNEFTQQARRNLERINTCLTDHWHDLDLTNAEFETLAVRQAARHSTDNKKPPFIDYASRRLYRVFSNSDLGQGGKFYGGWWESIPSEYRRHITIDGKWTIEMDYSNLHPFMLYAKEGLAFPGDAYAIEGVKDRDMVKVAFAKLLNGKKKLKKPEGYDDAAVGMGWKELLAAVERKHAPISRHFRTGYGNHLMFLDSQIAERIILNFAERGIPCLPVHDSFIVHHAHADELRSLMVEEYQQELAAVINIKEDHNFNWLTELHANTGMVIPPANDIFDGIIDNPYERRWLSWLDQQSVSVTSSV